MTRGQFRILAVLTVVAGFLGGGGPGETAGTDGGVQAPATQKETNHGLARLE